MKAPLVIFTFFVLVSSALCYSQEAQIDRMKVYIEKSKDDSTKVDTLIELSKQYTNKSPDGAIHFANLAKDLAEKIGYAKGVAKALKSIGNSYYNKGTYVESITFWQQAMIIFDSLDDKNNHSLLPKSY